MSMRINDKKIEMILVDFFEFDKDSDWKENIGIWCWWKLEDDWTFERNSGEWRDSWLLVFFGGEEGREKGELFVVMIGYWWRRYADN